MIARSSTTVRRHVAALLAVVALLGQTLFPHVHGGQEALRRSAPDAAVARCGAECPAVLLTAPAPEADGESHQHSTGCPLCRAQNDARASLLSVSLVLPLPVSLATRVAIRIAPSITDGVRSPAAPRAPPAVA